MPGLIREGGCDTGRFDKEVEAMPELPEIETIKNVIEPQIQGIAIEKVTVNRPEVVAHPGAG